MSVALLLSSGGFESATAVAQVIGGGKAVAVPVEVPLVPAGGAPLDAGLAMEAGPGLALPPAAGKAPAGIRGASGAPGTAIGAAQGPAKTSRAVLEARAAEIGKAGAEQGRQAAIDGLFTGSQGRGADAGFVPDGAAAGAADVSRLAGPNLGEIERIASDSSRPAEERKAAVAALARRRHKAALERIAGAHPEGGAAEYEIHRAALRALAELGIVRSLRPVTRAHADEILAKLADEKPQAAYFDYDGTLEDLRKSVSPEIAAGLEASRDAGVDTAVVTTRPGSALAQDDVGIDDSFAGATRGQKYAITVAADNGARVLLYDRRERLVPVQEVGLADKAMAVAYLRSSRDFRERLGDVLRSPFTRWLFEPARKLFARVKSGVIAGDKTLVVGDSFNGPSDSDSEMTLGAPGALALAVGGAADPRVDNVFVWPAKGRAASLEILAALGKKPADRIDKKTAFGLFLGRSIGIAAFIAITIAYKSVVVAAVGWPGYGALMAFSPMAAIAAGPINGMIIDKLRARTGMLLNTGLRGALLLALPVFHWCGVLNFWTLLVAGLANGWILSAILATEGAYLSRLFPAKRVPVLNSLLQMNYFSIQVLLGLMLGLGRIVDRWNPFAVFVGAFAIQLVTAVITWLTIPNVPPPAKPAAATGREKKTPFLARYWKEAVVFVSSIGLYGAFQAPKSLAALGGGLLSSISLWIEAHPYLATPLPVAAALIFWIARTDGFKALWRGDYAKPSKEFKELSARKEALAAELAAAAGNAGDVPAKRDELDRVNKDLAKEPGRLRAAIFLLALGAFMMYPLQYFGILRVAEALAGKSSGLLIGQFLGSLFFGNLISMAGQAELPEVRLPFIGRARGERLIQAGVLALAGAWVFTALAPGSLLASAAAVAAAAGFMAFACKLTGRAWVGYAVGFGFASLWLVFAAWTWPALLPFLSVRTAMFISLILIGMAYGQNSNVLFNYVYGNASGADMGKAVSFAGSFFNAAVSIGYASLAIAAAVLTPSFPPALAVWGAVTLLGGLVFRVAGVRLPGLPKNVFAAKEGSKGPRQK